MTLIEARVVCILLVLLVLVGFCVVLIVPQIEVQVYVTATPPASDPFPTPESWRDWQPIVPQW